jgi:hypothetical protein
MDTTPNNAEILRQIILKVTFKAKLPELRKNAGSKSLFEKATFEDLKLAALVESEKLMSERKS